MYLIFCIATGLLALVPALGLAQSSSQNEGSTPPRDYSQGSVGRGPLSGGDRAAAVSPASGESHSAVDQQFISQAWQRNMAELELGRLGQQKATNPEVKLLSTKIVEDHTRANEELKEIAKSLSVTSPTALDPKYKETNEKLSQLSGSDFDRAYINEIVTVLGEGMPEFRLETNSGNSRKVKQFAARALPVRQEHLMTAVQILKRLGGPTQPPGLQGTGGGPPPSTPGAAEGGGTGNGAGERR
jgi:putative membrane protein